MQQEERTLYVAEQGATISKTSHRIVIRNTDKKIIQEIPFFKVEQIIIIGRVNLTPDMIFSAFNREIDVVFVSRDGRFKGRLTRDNQKLVNLRRKQYERSYDNEFRLGIAKSIVAGKLKNQRTILMRYNRDKKADVAREIIAMKISIDSVDKAKTIEALMGLEGIGARSYFSGLKCVLKQDLGFKERVKRPPKDPVNAMLSFGYTMLSIYVESAVSVAGLDFYIGNLHAFEDRRKSLVLDLMEEFRPVVVDSVILSMVNTLEITGADFYAIEGCEGIFLTDEGRAKFIKALERRFASEIRVKDEHDYSYRGLFKRQAMLYRKAVLGENKSYEPYLIR